MRSVIDLRPGSVVIQIHLQRELVGDVRLFGLAPFASEMWK